MNGITGGSVPAAIWNDFMSFATVGMGVRDFPTPSLEPYDASEYVPLSTYTTASEYVPPEPSGDASSEGSGSGNESTGGGNGNANGHGNGNENGHD
jgi:membrane peptidoglycan carboxypeptidase